MNSLKSGMRLLASTNSRCNSGWKNSTGLRKLSNLLGEAVKDIMAVFDAMRSHDAIKSLTDEELAQVTQNTLLNLDSMEQFYSALVNERVRRGLKLPDRRNLTDDAPAQF